MVSAELRKCIRDIGYEFKMVGVLANVRTPTGVPFLGFGLLEAFLVHIRVLDDFLANLDGGHADALVARDYLASWTGNGFLTNGERKAIAKMVAHLSRQRQDPKARQDLINCGALNKDGSWKRDELGNRALTAASVFVAALDGEVRRPFDMVMLEAWTAYREPYDLDAVPVKRSLRPDRITVQPDGHVIVWSGTSVLVRGEHREGDAPEP